MYQGRRWSARLCGEGWYEIVSDRTSMAGIATCFGPQARQRAEAVAAGLNLLPAPSGEIITREVRES